MIEKLLKIVRYVIPVFLLGFIFMNTSFKDLGEVYQKGDRLLIAITFLSFPIRYLLFTLRWKLVLNMFGKKHIAFSSLLKTMYIGFFTGFYVPASVGIDIYRVTRLRKSGTNHINVGLIFQEKLLGLVVCSFFVLFFSSFLTVDLGKIYPSVRSVLYAVLVGTIILLLILFFFKKNKQIQLLFKRIDVIIQKIIKRFAKKFNRQVETKEGFINEVLKVSLFPKLIILVFAFGAFNQFLGAVFANIAFKAFDADIPLLFNLFANPLLNIIFLFPISFGGFGVREGAYIIIFGLLGVVSEISLLVSFVFLLSTLINVAIGGVLFALEKNRNT